MNDFKRIPLPKKWTKEKVLEDAKNYTSLREWRQNSPGSYWASQRYKIYNQATVHMIRKRKIYTNEEIIADAKLYSHKVAWQKNSMLYQIAHRRNILDIACKHMQPIGNRFKRQVYAIENEDRSVYVGISYNPERRYKEHIRCESKQTCDKILHKHYINGKQKLRVFETFYSLEEIQKEEGEHIEKYRNGGWIILNTAKAGALGTPIKKYTREHCAEFAKSCLDKRDFQLKYKIAYDTMCRRGWLDIIGHLPCRKREAYKEAEIVAVALQCKTRIEFFRRFQKYYYAAQNHNILEKVTEHLPSKHKNKKKFKLEKP